MCYELHANLIQSNCCPMMDYRTKLWLLAFLTLLGSIEAKRPYIIEVSNFTCVALEPSYVTELICILYKKRLEPTIYARFQLKNPEKQFNVYFQVDVLKKDNTKMNIARNEFDGCKYLGAFYGNNIFGRFLTRLRSVSNLPNKCPIPANKLFEVRNYTILADDLHPGLPALSFQLIINIANANKLLVGKIFLAGKIIY